MADLHNVFQRGVNIDSLIEMANDSLQRNDQAEILVLVGVHCDLTDLEKWSQDDTYSCMIPKNIDVEQLVKKMVTATIGWENKFPNLLIIWTLPYIPNFQRYNQQRTSRSAIEYHLEEEIFSRYCSQFLTTIQQITSLWWKLTGISLFHMNRLYPRVKSVHRIPKKLDSSAYDGETTDGLHPGPRTAKYFWLDLMAFARRQEKNFNNGKIRRDRLKYTMNEEQQLEADSQEQPRIKSMIIRPSAVRQHTYRTVESQDNPSRDVWNYQSRSSRSQGNPFRGAWRTKERSSRSHGSFSKDAWEGRSSGSRGNLHKDAWESTSRKSQGSFPKDTLTSRKTGTRPRVSGQVNEGAGCSYHVEEFEEPPAKKSRETVELEYIEEVIEPQGEGWEVVRRDSPACIEQLRHNIARRIFTKVQTKIEENLETKEEDLNYAAHTLLEDQLKTDLFDKLPK